MSTLKVTDIKAKDGISALSIADGTGKVTFPSNIVLSAGIDFGTSTDGTGTVTGGVLDDYEEGSWAPTVSVGVSSGSISSTSGNYTKIGNTVSIKFKIVGSGMGISSYLSLTNLPFVASISSTGCYGTNDISSYTGETFTVDSSTIYIKGNGSTGMTLIEGTSTYYTS